MLAKFIAFKVVKISSQVYLLSSFFSRACLKNALRKMCVTICGRFCSDEGVVVDYDNRIRTKYTAKWGVQIAGMIFQTLSSTLYDNRVRKHIRKCAVIRSSRWRYTGLAEKSVFIILKHSSICQHPSLTFKISLTSSLIRSVHTA